VPHSVDEGTFRAYFSQFGEVLESWLMYDPGSQRPRGFGFVIFAHEEALAACLSRGSRHELHSKFIDVKRATPRGASAPPVRSFHQQIPHGGGPMGGGMGGGPMGGGMGGGPMGGGGMGGGPMGGGGMGGGMMGGMGGGMMGGGAMGGGMMGGEMGGGAWRGGV